MIGALLLTTLSCGFSHHRAAAVSVGDGVCLTGYIMDNFCVFDNGGVLLDRRDVLTLQNPEEHSFHCLVDVGVCATSGYQVLGAKDPATDRHCPGFRLNETDAVRAAGRARGRRGDCSSCTGEMDSDPEYGYRATVKGTVAALGDGSDGTTIGGVPLLAQVEILDESVGCEGAPTVPPLCTRSMETAVPESTDLKVGDDVCITNYIMDRFCIDLGHFLDDDKNAPLENPELHSFHCLLDVDRCRESGYLVLTDKQAETDRHCLGYRLDDTDAVLEAGRKAGRAGYCTDCTGDASAPERGFRATVKGRVKELGDGTDGVTGTPVLENIVVLDESVECKTTIVAPVCAGTAPDAPSGMEPALAARDCTSAMCENQLSPDFLLRYQINMPADTTADACDGCTLSVELVYEDEAWVSLAFSTTGKMVGSEAVIGIPGEGGSVPLKYSLGGFSESLVQPMPESQQTLSGASVVVQDGRTIVKFTKIMKEPGEIEVFMGDNTFLWAHGSDTTLGYHGATKAPFELNLSSGTSEQLSAPNRAVWLAHGVGAFLAWGVLVPWAVQSSLLRAFLPQGPLWFKLHRALNTLAYACFVVIFVMAVAYTSAEGGPHFGNSHQRMGLVMFVLACFQMSGGVFRPHVPDDGGEKSIVRKAWEVGHRVIGVTLLACGFWQMRKGIELYAIKYSVSEENEEKLSIAYWVWIGAMSAIIVLGGGYFKFKSKSPDDTNNDDGVEIPKAATAGDGV